MPQLALSDEEIRHLVAFLLSRNEGAAAVAAAPPCDPRVDAAAARALITRYRCPSCHAVNGFPPPPPGFELAAGAPDRPTTVMLRDGRLLLNHYNCRGCHRIEGVGGTLADRLDRKTFAPPGLDGEGARVQASWLVQYLRRPTTLRPWLHIRMPDYGLSEGQARTLAAYFAALARVPMTDEPSPDAATDVVAQGLRRVAHFKCGQCHIGGADAPLPKALDPEDLATDLTLAKTRLRPSWIRHFLARPKAVVGTDTRMPSVFYTIDGAPTVDHPEQDIEAITAYLLHMSEPLDVALGRLDAERQDERHIQDTDWRTYAY